MLDRNMPTTTEPDVSRRGLLGAVAAGAFLVGFHAPSSRSQAAEGDELAPPDGFIRIDRQGDVTLIMPQVEMGQGTYTSLSMILAEELDAAWDKVRVEHAPPNEKLYANPMLSIQATGNSNSVRAFWTPMRKAGAGARATLIAAAAQGWGVPVAECRTDAGVVLHDKSGRKAGYGDLVARAATLPVPKDPSLKDPKAFRLIGKPLHRLDTPDKTNGKVVYGIDVLPPGVKFATIAQSPVLGGKVARADDAKAKAVPGVRQVVVLDNLVAVVGDHMWAAKQGLAAMDITWDDGPNGGVSTEQIW
jgi:isoquinoline 1-oxidoreductase beta subunit